MTWLGHSSVAGRKKDRDVVWTAGKGGDVEKVGGREGSHGVAEKVLGFLKKRPLKMMESLTLMLYFKKHVHDCSFSEYSRVYFGTEYMWDEGSLSQLNGGGMGSPCLAERIQV